MEGFPKKITRQTTSTRVSQANKALECSHNLSNDLICLVVLVGDMNVGKSNIL